MANVGSYTKAAYCPSNIVKDFITDNLLPTGFHPLDFYAHGNTHSMIYKEASTYNKGDSVVKYENGKFFVYTCKKNGVTGPFTETDWFEGLNISGTGGGDLSALNHIEDIKHKIDVCLTSEGDLEEKTVYQVLDITEDMSGTSGTAITLNASIFDAVGYKDKATLYFYIDFDLVDDSEAVLFSDDYSIELTIGYTGGTKVLTIAGGKFTTLTTADIAGFSTITEFSVNGIKVTATSGTPSVKLRNIYFVV